MNQNEMSLGIGAVLSPQLDPQDVIGSASSYLALSDQLLEAVLDAANIGREESCAADDIEASHRFGRIIELVEMYRAGIEKFDMELAKSRSKLKVVKAGKVA